MLALKNTGCNKPCRGIERTGALSKESATKVVLFSNQTGPARVTHLINREHRKVSGFKCSSKQYHVMITI